jgi:hypothetical protein
MELRSKLILKPGRTTRKVKLKEWDPSYTAKKKKEDVENELT